MLRTHYVPHTVGRGGAGLKPADLVHARNGIFLFCPSPSWVTRIKTVVSRDREGRIAEVRETELVEPIAPGDPETADA